MVAFGGHQEYCRGRTPKLCVCVCLPPSASPQDIELLPIGDKSKAKLQEILATGRLRRNELVEASEQHRTLQLFMT